MSWLAAVPASTVQYTVAEIIQPFPNTPVLNTASSGLLSVCSIQRLLDRIIAASGSFSLLQVCKAIRNSSLRVIDQEWNRMPLSDFPRMQKILAGLGAVPRNIATIRDLNAAVPRGTGPTTEFSAISVLQPREDVLKRADDQGRELIEGMRTATAALALPGVVIAPEGAQTLVYIPSTNRFVTL